MKIEQTRRGRREMLAGLSDAVEVKDFSGIALAGMRVMTSEILQPGSILVNAGKQTAFVHELDLIALKCGSDLEMRQAMVVDYFTARTNRELDEVIDLIDAKIHTYADRAALREMVFEMHNFVDAMKQWAHNVL